MVTGWKRRSRAGSFSMYLRYSSRVVAPMHCSSPRARAGFRRLAASMPPPSSPLPPEPTSVCTSSMTRMTRRLLSDTSLTTARNRSSKSPRYLVPASSSARSSCTTRLSFSVAGTRPAAICCAKPSAMDVLPTPASPTSTGLFLERRPRMRMVRLSSSSRPMSGSILPSRAASVRSLPYFSVWVRSTSPWTGATLPLALVFSTLSLRSRAPTSFLRVASSLSSAPISFLRVASTVSHPSNRPRRFVPVSGSSWSRMARSKCEVPTKDLPCLLAH
mmetsp:Transcript_21977/g.58826  ORF Transcript_21977/g.58826 Transcript_21977/m.58826 type:complete len:274 (+) Transcript_21977:1857-2678(+)